MFAGWGWHCVLMSAPTPARLVVEAFGDSAALAAMYTDDVTWRLKHSLAPNIAGPHIGKAGLQCGVWVGICAFRAYKFLPNMHTY